MSHSHNLFGAGATGKHVGPPPDGLADFNEWCSEMGVTESLMKPVRECFEAWHGVDFVPITFLVPRPRPVAGNPTGIANMDCITVIVDRDGPVIPTLNLVPLDSDALARYSGTETQLPRTLLIGGGAMGSKLATHLGRTCVTEMDVVDPDVFIEHNLGRHDLRRVHVGLSKAEALIDELSRMTNDFHGSAYVMTLQKAILGGRISPTDYGLAIDATAAPGMPFVLCYFDELPRMFSVFTVPRGALGIATIEGPDRNPRLDDLEAVVYSLAAEREDVRTWLRARFVDYVGVGGCGDISAVIADDVVSFHASRFSQILRTTALEEGEGAIWIHDVNGSLTRLPAGRSGIIEAENWWVRIGWRVRETVFRMLEQHKPKEVAGYLHGMRDSSRKEIIVAHASVEPLLVQSESKVEIDTSQYENPSVGTLEYLGSWHAHPKGGTVASGKDETTHHG